MLVHTPVSWGELLDKMTILEIKSERIADKGKLANIGRELEELRRTVAEAAPGMPESVKDVIRELKRTNEKLWVIEDDIRNCERQKDFGPTFIELARSVYVTNDQRFKLKRELNDALGSALVEEKGYAAY